MNFTEDEKKLLKHLVEKEIEQFSDDEAKIRPIVPQFLAIEEKYDLFLKKLLEKI